VLLDIDGTLVDSNEAHARAWHDAFTEVGVDGGDVARIRRLVGMGGDKVIPEAVALAEDSPEGKRISDRRSAIFKERYLPHLRPTPGAADLVRALEERGLRVGVATSAKPDELREMLRQVGVPETIADAAASSEDADASKPDPDIVEAALGRIGVQAGSVVLVGDTPYDVTAAGRAGVSVIGLRSGGWTDEELAGAIAVFQDPADLVAHLDETPLRGTNGAADGT
jgi:HAD superfamily hydrolase (TIGR01509 family)